MRRICVELRCEGMKYIDIASHRRVIEHHGAPLSVSMVGTYVRQEIAALYPVEEASTVRSRMLAHLDEMLHEFMPAALGKRLVVARGARGEVLLDHNDEPMLIPPGIEHQAKAASVILSTMDRYTKLAGLDQLPPPAEPSPASMQTDELALELAALTAALNAPRGV